MDAKRRLRRLVFEGGSDERDEHETPLRGYRSHVVAQLEDGSQYRLTFYDPVRLKQVLDDEVAAGRPFFAEPGLNILPEVTRTAMELAAAGLCASGFFDTLRPTADTLPQLDSGGAYGPPSTLPPAGHAGNWSAMLCLPPAVSMTLFSIQWL